MSFLGLASKFISLGKVPSSLPQAPLDVKLKFVHSLKLQPASVLPAASILAVPVSSTPSPYFSLYNPHSIIKQPLASKSQSSSSSSPSSSSSSSSTPSSGDQDFSLSLQDDDLVRNPRVKRIRTFQKNYNDSNDIESSSPSHLNSSNSCQRTPNDDELMKIQGNGKLSLNSISSNSLILASPQKELSSSNLSSPLSSTSPRDLAAAVESRTSPIHSGTKTPSESPLSQSNIVSVTNIPYEVNIENFMNVMQSFGQIINLNFPKSPDGRSTGRAYVISSIKWPTDEIR